MRSPLVTQLPVSLLLVLLLLLGGCASGSADEGIVVEEAWARALPADGEAEDHADAHGDYDEMAMGETSAAYLLVRNHSATDDRLVAARMEFAMVEIHQTTIEDGIAHMEHLTDGLVVPARSSVALEPGSYHLMLIDLQRPLAEGDTFDLILTFENAGDVTVPVRVHGP